VRLFHELELILHEENPILAIARLAELDLLKPIHPRLWFDEGTRNMLERVQAVLAWMDLSYLEEKFERWLVYFLGLVEPLTTEEIRGLLDRFKPPPRLAAAILEGKESADQALLKLFRLGEASRSEIYHLLSPIGTEFLLYMMAKSRQGHSRRLTSLYFTHLKHLKPELGGRDLISLGFQPGPQIREILTMLHEARLNEVIQSKREELELIKRTWGEKAAS